MALVGQPNVGKSSLFTRLTGVGVISSNYPGTTVEFEESVITRQGTTVRVHDLPGTYGLSGNSADEKVVLEMLRDQDNDAVIVVADALNLESSIVLCFEVMEMGLPAILALNKTDSARKKFDIDVERLEVILGIEVIPVSAKTAEGVDALADAVCLGLSRRSDFKVRYDDHIEYYIRELSSFLPENHFDRRGRAVKILEGTEEFRGQIPEALEARVIRMRAEFESTHGESMEVAIGRDRYASADVIVKRCVSKTQRKPTRAERISDMTTTPSTGLPILIAVFFSIFLIIVYVGSALAEAVEAAYDMLVGTALVDIGRMLAGDLGEAVMRGIDESIRAILGLVIPYIMVFYLILGILEDSGYLPRVVVLLDRLMHRFGLHGGSVISLVVGIGCNVPAILSTRSLASRREKLITCTMIVMAVPCSAQMAIIMGATATHAGILYAFGILMMLGALAVVLGVLLNRFLKKEPSNLAMELPDLVVPQARNVLFKMWYRIKDFFFIAFPLLVVGSIVVEIMMQFGALDIIVDPLAFITVGMLGLPAVTIIAFIVGILRKEAAVGMLGILTVGGIPLIDVMTPDNFVVFGVVMAVYMPCLATIVVMGRELGWRDTLAVSVLSITIAILLGAVCNLLLSAF
ncbi:MAG: ferrous iron transport protein B [Candidatus Methanomethylophilaceae archaeon]|nr:ferrous iron transport protein B [Candidatus Methanomethylophilaceae archaeon]